MLIAEVGTADRSVPCPEGAGDDGLKFDLISQGRAGELIPLFESDLASDPDQPDALLNLGTALRMAGRLGEAAAAFRQALVQRPGWDLALYSLSTTLLDTGDGSGALAVGRETVARHPGWSLAHYALGQCLLRARSLPEAKKSLQTACALDPGLHLSSQHLGAAHLFSGELDDAIACYREALRLSPGSSPAHLDLGLALLARGSYTEGWEEYEWRWHQGGEVPRLSGVECPIWDGSPLHGKTILLWSEQGLGDILQFVRFATLVHERGGTVWLQCPRKLARLLATCPGVACVAASPDELPGAPDLQAPLATLPRLLGITLDNLPADVPYLTPPPDARTRDGLGPRRRGVLRVGFAWGIEPGHPTWQLRSCPLPLFRALETVPGIELYSLQFGELARELLRQDAPRCADLSAVLGDFAGTAALLRHLDLILTVDTSLAHLAGALGQRVWTLLPLEPDWRWRLQGATSAWYPTMRLFRQTKLGDWAPVLDQVAAALREESLRCAIGASPAFPF